MEKYFNLIFLIFVVVLSNTTQKFSVCNLIQLTPCQQNINSKNLLVNTKNISNTNNASLQHETIALKLYEYLKANGWQFSEAKQLEKPLFDSTHTISFYSTKAGFNSPKKIYFSIMCFDSEQTAKKAFPIISKVYKNKFGIAIIEKNLVISCLGGTTDNINRYNQLTQEEINKLTKQLKQFCDTNENLFIISKVVQGNNKHNALNS